MGPEINEINNNSNTTTTTTNDEDDDVVPSQMKEGIGSREYLLPGPSSLCSSKSADDLHNKSLFSPPPPSLANGITTAAKSRSLPRQLIHTEAKSVSGGGIAATLLRPLKSSTSSFVGVLLHPGSNSRKRSKR
eukprot:TRINITY_DN8702_c0_g1_i1.p1 TRINITY_DN8702_c0_g1~~TRINITY_DN8702_c0_g1_i1.p1  ORF type:complete len:133 (-),score=54.21 TRINITY_DN8702_c0_g1_i1:443-841(-)